MHRMLRFQRFHKFHCIFQISHISQIMQISHVAQISPISKISQISQISLIAEIWAILQISWISDCHLRIICLILKLAFVVVLNISVLFLNCFLIWRKKNSLEKGLQIEGKKSLVFDPTPLTSRLNLNNVIILRFLFKFKNNSMNQLSFKTTTALEKCIWIH